MNQDGNNKEGIDLSGTFKNSDTGVKFQDKWQRPAQTFFPGTPKIIHWIIKYSGGLVRDEKQASYVIFGFVAVAIIVILFLIFGGSTNEIKSPKQDILNLPQPEEGYIPW